MGVSRGYKSRLLGAAELSKSTSARIFVLSMASMAQHFRRGRVANPSGQHLWHSSIGGFWLLLVIGFDSRQMEPSTLFSEDFLHLADFLLDFPAYSFANTFGF